jgi:ABC-type nitrate/sulfonate/bicarbonate transport system substrate-binding protein
MVGAHLHPLSFTRTLEGLPMFRASRFLAFAAFATALSIAAAHAEDKLRVGTPEPTAFVFAPVNVGIESGIFKKHGLDVERIDFAGGAKLHQGMVAGAIDMIVGTGSDILFLMKGAKERAVAAYANDLNSLSLIVRADDPSIKTVADIKGKVVGTTTAGSFTTWISKTIAKNHGWGPDGIQHAYLGAMSSMIAGLMAKNVDAIVGTTSQGLVLEKQGKARVLVNAGDEIKDFIADMIYAGAPIMKEHPDQVRRFLAAWFETLDYMRGHKSETIRITQKVTKLPDDVAAKVYDVEIPTFFKDGHFDRKKFAAVKQALLDTGVIDKSPPDDQLIDESFLPKGPGRP